MIDKQRKSIRLKDYDYSQNGAYFITICAYNRENLFGEIKNHKMILNNFGSVVFNEWIKSSEIREEILLDEFVVMPNHFHGIVVICAGDRPVAPTMSQDIGLKANSIGSLIAGFKSAVTTKINKFRETPGTPIWQRNYYEHIIRNEASLHDIREYIINNPMNWHQDKLNTINSIISVNH